MNECYPIPAVDVEYVSTPNPHYLPGYTGHCPDLKFRYGKSYGRQTHELFLDKNVSHAEKLVLSDKEVIDYEMRQTKKDDLEIVNARLGFGLPEKCKALTNCSSSIDNNEDVDLCADECKQLGVHDGMILCDYLERKQYFGPIDVGATKIYHKHVGQLPNYGGHIPGEIFRCGKTYGTNTIDGKRYLRGDTS